MIAKKKKSTSKTAAAPMPSKPRAVGPAKQATPKTTGKVATAPVLNDTDTVTFPVVGMGASAGGLEALTEFFRAMSPRSGLAFVVVTHLDPDRKSALTEILSRVTPMSVSEVSDGTELLPDCVYVIPPNTNMEVEGDRLRLVPRGETRGPHMPIDVFLRSLAVARKSRGGDSVGDRHRWDAGLEGHQRGRGHHLRTG